MARRYFTVPHFVQNINIELLDAYFEQANIPFPENLRILEEDNKPKANDIEEYINGLEAEKQYQISTDFMEVNEMSYEGGILSIIEYGETQGKHLQEDINNQDGYVNQSMYCFLNYKDIFEGASQVAYFDNLSTKIVKYNLLKKSVADVSTQEIKTELETVLKKYFKQSDGRGQNCEINIIKYKDRVFYHAMPQNFSQFIFDYDENNKLRRNVVRPIFEIIYIYYPAEGKLELSVKLGNRRRNELVAIFNEIVLKDDRPLLDGQQAYDFNRLLSPEFKMPTKAEDEISWLYLKQLRLSYRYIQSKRITLEIDDKETKGAEAIHEMIKELGLNTEQLNVTQATIKMKFQGAGNKGSVTAVLTYPDKCNLTDKPTHQKTKEYIKYWGLELNNEQGD